MIGLVITFAFAVLFTGVTIRLAFGGLFDAPVIFAAIITLFMWVQVYRRLRRGVGI